MSDNDIVLIAGYPVCETTQEALAERIYSRMNSAQKSVLFFANTNFVVKCNDLKQRMIQDEIIIVNDGFGMDIASLLFYKRKFKNNLNGTDFTPYFLKNVKTPLRIFLVGGKPEVLNRAAYYLVHDLNHIVVGSCDGYDGMKNAKDLVSTINQVSADVVMVALGNAKQEEWILQHYQQINAQFFTGVGALFDFWAFDKPRAPQWIQRIRMEWFYRLCLEPKRLYRRYTIDIVKFLAFCIKYRKQRIK